MLSLIVSMAVVIARQMLFALFIWLADVIAKR